MKSVEFVGLARGFLTRQGPEAIRIEAAVRAKLVFEGDAGAETGFVRSGIALLVSRAPIGNGQYVRILWDDGPSVRRVWHLSVTEEDAFEDWEGP